jgi:signal transduction histidine kinase
MSETSLGIHATQQTPAAAHNHHGGDDRHDACGIFHQRLQRLALALIVIIVIIGAAAVTATITLPSIAVVVTAASVVACVSAVVTLMSWTITRAATGSSRQRGALLDTAPDATDSDSEPWREPAQAWFQPGGDRDEVAARPHPVSAEPPNGRDDASPDPDDPASTDIVQRREVWVTLARRLQTLIYRAIKMIDGLENKIEDPEILADIYKVDNIITLALRKAENIAVLGGDPPQRRSSGPVELHSALIACVSEVERFKQIAIVPTSDAFAVHGYAAAEIIHLLAELLENATQFSNPDGPKVEVRAYKVTAGLAIEIQDRGLGLDPERLRAINGMLDGTAKLDIADHLRAGQIGLAVVRELGRRNRVPVQLQTNIYGGVAAVVVLPRHLLVDPTVDVSSLPASAPAPLPAVLPAPNPVPPEPASSGLSLTGVLAAPASASTEAPDPLDAPTGRHHPLPTRVPRPVRDANATAMGDQGAPRLPRPSPADYPPGEFAPVPLPPPLPQRNRSYMHPNLQAPSSTPSPSAVPGHNTALFADVQAGRDHWHSEQAPAAEPFVAAEDNGTDGTGEDRPDTTRVQTPPTTRGETWPMK